MKNKFFNTINDFRVKHEPEILMGVGITGLVFSTTWAIKATIDAVKICEEKKARENKEKLTAKEIFKETWKLYLPVVLSTGISVPCIIAGNRISSKRMTALTTAYALSTTALNDYKNKIEEELGAEKKKEIEQKISQDKVTETSDKSKEIVINDEDEHLFHDEISGRYFKSTWNKILAAANDLNEECLTSINGSFTLNDWYDRIGLDGTSIGYWIGWSTPGYDNNKGLMKISLSTTLTKDNKPCGSIHYDVLPYPIN